jgi:hypothetical protein
MLIAAPKSPRELFQLFYFYDPSKGLASILDNIDFDGVTPGQVYYSTLGRLPESAQQAAMPPDYAARDHYQRTLHSQEFQRSVIKNFLSAYPEKRRLLFVHIPKCAGTDLSHYLGQRYPALHQTLSVEAWSDKASFFKAIRDLALQVNFADSIFVHGHMRLRWYLGNAAYRFGDRLFTVVRDPTRIITSQVNYVITRFLADREAKLPDTRDWLARLGMERIAADPSPEYLTALARRILRDTSMVPRNYLCHHLGNGDAESALQNLASCDVEITDVVRYQTWLKESWGIEANSRHNASRQIISKEQLAPDDARYVESLVDQDQILYDRIIDRLKSVGGLSIRGYDVA